MKYRYLALSFGAIFFSFLFVISSCRKINAVTELGGGLIPAVDNITTFDTTITVEAYNDLFTILNDSIRSSSSDEQFLGLINNDPFFGKTDARMFFQLTPPNYRYSFLGKPDSLHLDSIVLVLDYNSTYGDTTVAQTINVYEIDPFVEFRRDSNYLVRENIFTYSSLLGSRNIRPENLKDSVKAYQDTTAKQLRIRLSDVFGQRLLTYDTTGVNDGYSSDSVFKSKFKGFALQSVGIGNAIMGFNLTGVNTKLAIYYKDDNGDAPVNKWDTAVAYFTFTGFSAGTNFIKRDYSTSELIGSIGGTSPDPVVYIQNTPGTFATLKIPHLAGLNNRVIHRAELVAEQLYHISDSIFPPPVALFLDAYDPTAAKYRTIPYDVIIDQSGSANLGSFGVYPINAMDGFGNMVRTWHFNISRYVQHVVNDTEPVYDLRLTAPYYLRNELYKPPQTNAVDILLPFFPPGGFTINPSMARGRVRLIGNTGVNDLNPRRMRLHIIYSKL